MNKYLKQRILLLIVLLLSICYSNTFAQLRVSVGGGGLVHFCSSDEQYNNGFEGTGVRYQEIGRFFEVTDMIVFSTSYNFRTFNKNSKICFIPGFEYSRGTSSNKQNETKVYLGERLTISSYCPYIQMGYIPPIEERNLLLYLVGGLSIRNYAGEYSSYTWNKQLVYKAHETYKNSLFYRIGFGAEYQPTEHFPLLLSFEFDMELGKVERSNIDFTFDDFSVSVKPTGQIKLQDNSMLVKASLSYILDL